MSEYCVVVADGARARFFTLEPAEHPTLESGPRLIETGDLSNSEIQVPGREMWTDAKSGRHSTPGGGAAHGYDDHRSQHKDEYERRFATQVAQQAISCAQQHAAKHLVVAAESRMLGFLRDELEAPAKSGIQLREIATDLSKLSPQDIHDHLAQDELLPAHRGVGG